MNRSDSSVIAVFRVREFRFLWAAELLSIFGDQLARVALAVLVYGRTQSALWAAVVYALTFLPALFGGVLLSWLADRYRRRAVMVGADVARAVLVGAMALPGVPLWALCGLRWSWCCWARRSARPGRAADDEPGGAAGRVRGRRCAGRRDQPGARAGG